MYFIPRVEVKDGTNYHIIKINNNLEKIMIYILSGFFVLVGVINLLKGKKLKISPGVNKMDMISIGLVALIIIIAGFFFKARPINIGLIVISMVFYIATSRYGRGITENGVMINGGNPIMIGEYKFDEIKQVNVSNEGEYVAFAIVIKKRNIVDIQRYPKEMKPKLVKIFKDNNVQIIYK